MRKFILLVLFMHGVAMAQPKLNIPLTGLNVSTTFITPSTTVVTADMYVENLDLTFTFNDSLFIKVGVMDTLSQVFEMSSLNTGLKTILNNDSIYLPSVGLEINTSLFMDGNNTVVIWPAAPNSITTDSVELIFFYNGINELITNDIPVKLGPNPVKDKLYLYDPENLIKQVRIRGLNGALLDTYKPGQVLSFNHLAEGFYLIELQLEKGFVVRKLVIDR